MKILKLIGVLMDYPSDDLKAATEELQALLNQERVLPEAQQRGLAVLLDWLRDTDLMDAQSCYEGLFERGRSTSLLLFEHVHGDSRDRGQAMVDLMAVYERAGFAIAVRELPDYLPLYLEFLAQRPVEVAENGLQEVAHILRLLALRLSERSSPYAALFEALLVIAGESLSDADLQEKVAKEVRDDSLEALDRVWEEEMVTFMGDDATASCSSQQASRPVEQVTPVHWVNAGRAAAAQGSRTAAHTSGH